jgi:SPX domain protein involved in polyphosphate accumulation
VKSGEIIRRIKITEKEIEQVVKELNSDTEPSDETFQILEDEVCPLNRLKVIQITDIIADVHDLAHYTRLNYTAFEKILVLPRQLKSNY